MDAFFLAAPDRLELTTNRLTADCSTYWAKGQCLALQMSQSFWMQQQPIFPDRLQSSIFGASELNFCVRYENRWDLTANVTAMVYIQGFPWTYRFFVYTQYTLFFISRQFLYTIDSQLHRTFFFIKDFFLTYSQNCQGVL